MVMVPNLTHTADTSDIAAKQSVPDHHLAYLDGVRGLSALYVVVHHVLNVVLKRFPEPLPELTYLLTFWMRFGHYAVDIFIVLSGYCLMLPVMKSSERQLRGGFWAFIK